MKELNAEITLQQLQKRLAILEEDRQELVDRIHTLSLRDREKNSLIRTLFDNLPYGVVMFDRDRNIVQINQAAAEILGYERRHLIGKNCSVVMVCYEKNLGCPVLDGNRDLDQVRTNCLECGKTLLRSAVKNHSTEGEVVVESFVDITDLDRANIEKALALETKSNFLANISHELRTPMHGILGFSELLRGCESKLNDSEKKHLQHVIYSAQSLWALLEQLFQAASLESKSLQVTLEPVDLNQFLEALEKELQLKLADSSNTLEFTYARDLGIMNLDQLKLQQIIRALVENADKFTSSGTITVLASLKAIKGRKFLSVEVRDTGKGVAEAKQHEIFELFAQEDGSTSRSYQGAGLGLAIARQLALIMGGDIRLQSEPGKGSIFELVVPA